MIQEDIDHLYRLQAKYPYLAAELQNAIKSLREQQAKEDAIKDLPDYQGPEENRILAHDDINVKLAKLAIQERWQEQSAEW